MKHNVLSVTVIMFNKWFINHSMIQHLKDDILLFTIEYCVGATIGFPFSSQDLLLLFVACIEIHEIIRPSFFAWNT